MTTRDNRNNPRDRQNSSNEDKGEEVIEVIEEEIVEEFVEPAALQERVIHINRVAKVVKGGRRFTFTALVAMGDGMGNVGLGYGKAGDVLSAIRKGQDKAKKNMINVPLKNGTLPHSAREKYGAAVVFLKPASEGTGVIAGGPIRSILEVAGVRNVLAKNIGRTATKINVARATFNALSKMLPLDEVRARRASGSENN